MKSFFKSFAIVCIVASLTSCGLFDTEKPAQDPVSEGVDSIQKEATIVDSLPAKQDTASQDTGIVIKK
jgi:hypothetical protein